MRAKVTGTPERPRLTVQKTLRHIYAQIVDDSCGRTLAFVSSLSGAVQNDKKDKDTKTNLSFKVGKELAGQAKEKGIEKVVFDRQGNIYHGRIKAVADGARKGGLNF